MKLYIKPNLEIENLLIEDVILDSTGGINNFGSINEDTDIGDIKVF